MNPVKDSMGVTYYIDIVEICFDRGLSKYIFNKGLSKYIFY